MFSLRSSFLFVLVGICGLCTVARAITPPEELPRQQFIDKVHALGKYKSCYTEDWKELQEKYITSIKTLVESTIAVDPALINTPVDAQGNTFLHYVAKSDFTQKRLYNLIRWFAQQGADICRVNYNGELAVDNVYNPVCCGNFTNGRREIYLLMRDNLQAKMEQGLTAQEQRIAELLVAQRKEITTFEDVMEDPGLCLLSRKEQLEIAQFKGYLNAQLRIQFLNMFPYYELEEEKAIAQHFASMRWLLQHGAHPNSTGKPHDDRKLLVQLLFPYDYHKHSIPLAELLLEHGADVEGCNRYNTHASYLASVRFGRTDDVVKPSLFVLLLRKYGADINTCREDGISARQLACNKATWLYHHIPPEDFSLFCRAWDLKDPRAAQILPVEQTEVIPIVSTSSAQPSSSTDVQEGAAMPDESSVQRAHKKTGMKALAARMRNKYSKRSKKS